MLFLFYLIWIEILYKINSKYTIWKIYITNESKINIIKIIYL